MRNFSKQKGSNNLPTTVTLFLYLLVIKKIIMRVVDLRYNQLNIYFNCFELLLE